jgi:predicted ATPase/DNA-binding SARP family transcriptional activator
MDFRILGPLQVVEDGREIAPAGSKLRALLVVLLLHANETVSTERLIDELWGERPPANASKTLSVHISRLRKALRGRAGDGTNRLILTHDSGYQLTLDLNRLDSHRFERLSAEGKHEIASGHPDRAAAAFEAALSLWRGSPLADLASLPWAQGEIARLEDMRMAAIEDLNEAKLALGHHSELVGQLEAAIAEHPYRERLRAQLMLALYRCERQADALQAYQNARSTLVEDLGIEPGEPLRELERAILAQDSALAVAVDVAEPTASGLPARPDRLLGRDHDREAIRQILQTEDIRLVTLVGPGGVGKTSLALEVARRVEPELRDGAWFVSLAGTGKAEHVTSTIAQALDAKPLEGELPEEAIVRFLGPKDTLLVLDNFEHVLEAAPVVTELLSAAPSLAVLATSREPLRLRVEHRFDVAPLEIPAAATAIAVERASAGQLFVQRARSHDRAFALTPASAGPVSEICRRLDGIPLAIELAAARTTLLEPSELAARLASTLDLLGHGARDSPDRQRTLRATIEWSHDLLSSTEAKAFADFAVFAGGATTEAAQEVTGADLDALHALTDKQLLLRRHGSGTAPRLRMFETVREYASELLDADPHAAEIRERHYRYYLGLAERGEPHLLTRDEVEWLPKLNAEIDNFRAALDWSIWSGEPAKGLRLAGVLGRFWDWSNRSAEGLEWLQKVMDAAGDEAPVHDRARARWVQANLLIDQGAAYDMRGSRKEATSRAQESLALSREAGDPAGVANALLALAALDMAESHPQSQRQARSEEALKFATEARNARLVAAALFERACAVSVDSESGQIEDAVTALRKVGSTRLLVALYNNCSYNAIKGGHIERAGPFLAQAVPLARELGDPVSLAFTCGNVGLEALFTDDLTRAQEAFDEQLRLCKEHVVPHLAAEGLGGLAALAARRGDPERAALILGAAISLGPVGDADVNAQLEDQFFAPCRMAHGVERWEEGLAIGGEMTFEEAIDFALGAHASGG